MCTKQSRQVARMHQVRAPKSQPPRIRPALAALFEAVQYAEQTSGDRWDFAVEIDRLTALGLSRNDFRWLVYYRLVEHQREVTLEGDDSRVFRPEGRSTFAGGTCFILTDDGVSIAREIFQAGIASQSPSSPATRSRDDNGGHAKDNPKPRSNGEDSPTHSCLPRWDPERHELCFEGTTVKRFKWPAINQETILAVFEEEGWPSRIDDPLTPQPEQDSKRRLSDAIKCLNRKQASQLLHFRGDGTGEGVIWELVKHNGSDEESAS